MMRALISALVWLMPSVAYAYIGPGAGISAIGSLLALIAAVLLAIIGFFWYPIKRIVKKRQNAGKEASDTDKEPHS